MGILAILRASAGDLLWAGVFIVAAAVLDFFDGLAARALNAQSPIGKDLDSLADMVSFGVAPSVVWFNYRLNFGDVWFNYLAILIGIFAAIRLAKFNNDPRQSDRFYGLPSPSVGILVAAVPFMWEYDQFNVSGLLSSNWTAILFPVICGLLMVSNLPLFALKFKNFSWESNKVKYGFLVLSLGFIVLFNFFAVPMILASYILLSLILKFAE
jgi:CDP-diacylglycerol--serine O-phosphatidyltransferase